MTNKTEKNRPFQADIHIHSEHSHDSECPVSQICQSAVEKGMDLVCITDHCDLYAGTDSVELVKTRRQIVREIVRSIPKDAGVEVLVGVELGGGFLRPELAQTLVDSIPFDVVIGSVHGIMFRGEKKSTSRSDFGGVDEAALLEYLDGYMEAYVYIAEKLDVDVLGHLTYILRYINGKYKRNIDWRIQEEKIRRVFRAIIARDIALEINTSCVGSFYDEWLPAREIIDLYIEMGGRLFTLGSDAHKGEKIAMGFDAVKTYLRQKGINHLVYYKDRIPHRYHI